MTLKNLLTALILLAMPQALLAQTSPFAAAVVVNGNAVSYFEIDQRVMLLSALGTPGDLDEQARLALIDDRLRGQAAREVGVAVTEDELTTGMEEFAERAGLTSEQLFQALAQQGVEIETFQDFVGSGLLWRKVLQTRFQSKAFISDGELDAALALGTTAVQDMVLVTELILPLGDGQEAQSRALAADFSNRLKTYAAFEQAAAQFSVAPSRANAGKLEWLPLSSLPPQIASKILALNVGEITAPIETTNAVVLFQLRGIRESRTVAAQTVSIDYARLLIPGGRTAENLTLVAGIAGDIDTCDDLLAKAERFSENAYIRDVLPVGKIPQSIRRELAALDNNEVSTALTQGETAEIMVFLMLCGRTGELADGDREQIRTALFNQRMDSFDAGYLQELKGDAILLFK